MLIRTDANAEIASGHVMRCLSVADALGLLGADVAFVTSDGNAKEVIEGRGYRDYVLESDWRDLMGGADELEALCGTAVETVLLVDTYAVDRAFVDRMAGRCPVCYLGSKGGDLGALSLVANYSTDIDEGFYKRTYGPRGTRLLLGPAYAPLRAQFSGAFRESRGEIGRVLVTTGNTDPAHLVPRLLGAALADEALGTLEYEVVVGAMFGDADEVEAIAAGRPNVRLHRGVSDMAGLMAGCDVAVSANGTTVYELAAVGVPAVTFAMVREQEQSAESLARLGAVRYAGSVPGGDDVVAGAIGAVRGYAHAPEEAAGLAARAHSIVDGRGAERIARGVLDL